MHRVDDATATNVLPVALPVGPKPNGFFATNTIIQRDFMNSITEEICGLIEAKGIVLDKTNITQLYDAVFNSVHGFTKQRYSVEAVLVEASPIIWNLDNAQAAVVTLTANRTMDNPTNMKAGAIYTLRVIQDAVGGHVMSFGSSFLNYFPGIQKTPDSEVVLQFYCTGTKMLGSAVFNFNFDVDSQAHFNRLITLDDFLRNDLDQLITTLKEKGVWESLDDLCVIHNSPAGLESNNAIDSLYGLKGNIDSTLVNSPVFSNTLGFTMEAANSRCIDTEIVGTVNSLLQPNSASAFTFRSDSGGNEGAYLFGAFNGPITNNEEFSLSDGGINDFSGIIANNFDSVILPIADANTLTGFDCLSRVSNSEIRIMHEAAFAVDSTTASTGLPSNTLTIGARRSAPNTVLVANSYSFAAWGVGSGLSLQQMNDLRDAIQVYMTARGV